VLACALLLVYALAMGINLARGRRDIDCGCFKSALKQTISGWLIGRNLLLAAAAAALLLPLAGRTTGVLDYVTVGAGGAMLFLCCYALGVLTRRPMTRYDAAFARAPAARTGWKKP
ncbi:MAG: MauE/DoxX family redox-associated membrane protein, partial [Burkholderiales bacterium]